jgi:hypothetical protein
MELAGGAYVTAPAVVVYAPHGIGRRTGQAFRSLVYVPRGRIHPGGERRDVCATRGSQSVRACTPRNDCNAAL